MFSIRALLITSGLLGLARAHFTMNYPPTRHFDEDTEPQFCGGDSTASSNRTLFPLGPGGIISIDSHHPLAYAVAQISFDPNPQNFSQFNVTSSGQAYGFLHNFWEMTTEGNFCVPVDVSSLGVTGAADGTNATIIVTFNGGDGTLFQCCDITLSSTVKIDTSSSVCSNASTIVPFTSNPFTNSSTNSASSSGTASSGAPTNTKNAALSLRAASLDSKMAFGLGVGILGSAIGAILVL